jgi:pimeloyl-ACP methyl ester carboxylesterase
MTSRQEIHLAVSGTDDGAGPAWYVAAWLTVPDEPLRSELQVLVHGAGYDHRYWDSPVEPERYSYVEWAAARGIATLNIDRIGSGASSKPPSEQVTIAAQARVVSQIVAQARSGLGGVPPFGRVVLVGHSLGSVVTGYAGGTYHDADAVVLTGYAPLDGDRAGGEALIAGGFVPAAEGLPHLLGLVGDGYLASRAETRGQLLFWPSQTEPSIVAADAVLGSPVTRTELLDAGPAGPVIRGGSAPTLIVLGQYDVLLARVEAGHDCYETASKVAAISPAHFDFEVIPDAGHNLTLHRNAHTGYGVMNCWLNERAAAASGQQ